jgi:hypothetical protein
MCLKIVGINASIFVAISETAHAVITGTLPFNNLLTSLLPAYLALVCFTEAAYFYGQQNKWLRSLSGVLFPVGIGLFLFWCLDVAANALTDPDPFTPGPRMQFDPTIRKLQDEAVRWHLMLEDFLSNRLYIIAFLTGLLVLTALTYMRPQIHLVTKYIYVNNILHKFLIVLIATTTFNLVASSSIANHTSENLRKSSVIVYQVAIRDDINRLSEYLAIVTVKMAEKDLSTDDKQRIIVMLHALSEEKNARNIARYIANADIGMWRRVKFGDEAAFTGIQSELSEAVDEDVIRSPATRRDWDHQLTKIVAAEQAAVRITQRRNDEMRAAVVEGISTILGPMTPRMEGLAGAYINEVIDSLTDQGVEEALDQVKEYNPTIMEIRGPFGGAIRNWIIGGFTPRLDKSLLKIQKAVQSKGGWHFLLVPRDWNEIPAQQGGGTVYKREETSEDILHLIDEARQGLAEEQVGQTPPPPPGVPIKPEGHEPYEPHEVTAHPIP